MNDGATQITVELFRYDAFASTLPMRQAKVLLLTNPAPRTITGLSDPLNTMEGCVSLADGEGSNVYAPALDCVRPRAPRDKETVEAL